MLKLKKQSGPATSPLEKPVQELQHVETLNKCVQTSIGGLAALTDPARWFALVADASDAARKDPDDLDLEDLFERILEHTKKASH